MTLLHRSSAWWSLTATAIAAACFLASCGTEPRPEAPARATDAVAGPQSLTFPDDSFRAVQPPPAQQTPFAQPRAVTFTMGDGCEVLLVERHALPTVSIELVCDGGAIDDPVGKEGLASLSLALMGEGTERLEKIAFREALADIAANVTASATTDQQSVSMTSLTRTLDDAIALWAETIARPGLRQADFDRLIKARLTSLQQIAGAPQRISTRLRDRVAWGPDHPYGRVFTAASTSAIALADCRTYIAERFRTAPARLYVVGDITEAQIRARIAPHLAAVRGSRAESARLGPAAPREGRVFLVDKPGAAQSMVSVLKPGPLRTADDYPQTAILGAILGGGFSGRINMNIREKNGYAYGAFGGFLYQRAGSVFHAGGA
ncbi:MAG: insulinase family protein, partial [Planctomycetes bacterium]|nr:insulinase family protein [Planctomycetota bacterium]